MSKRNLFSRRPTEPSGPTETTRPTALSEPTAPSQPSEPSGSSTAQDAPESSLPPVERIVETVLPTRHGTFRMVGFLGRGGAEHVTLSMGVTDGASPGEPVLVRLHSECLTGDALGSWRCDCGIQLDAALARIAAEGSGVLVYVRGHEGRGIGLLEKLKAYRLQDGGADTVDANLALGHPSDARTYDEAAAVLLDLGLRRIRLMSSNPAKEDALRALGVEIVERTGMFIPEPPHSVGYLATKRARMGHDLPRDDGGAWQQLRAGVVPVSVDSAGDTDLVDRYGPLVASGPDVVYAQMAQSLDGFIATPSGDAFGLSGPEDHVHLHRLRALADAVLVGAGTVVADDPRLSVREVEGANPVRVVIDPRARIPLRSKVLSDDEAPTIWLVGDDVVVPRVHSAHVNVVRLSRSDFEPGKIVALLRERALVTLLVEGGGVTVSRFLGADCIDRLFLTTVPVLLGDGVPGVRARPVATIGDAARPSSRRFALGADLCTELVLH
ncbi:GTP cyclohydrolase II [Phycicoccus sp.]|uniref:GTP cyclohydrolase II n=1 Tax=Phycicoccus sp. TaxID=1902410 RepID=UPI00345EE171